MELWIKSLHLISVMAWMVGLWYLPRLFIYHTKALNENQDYTCQLFSKMERRLMSIIMLPAFLLSWISGLTLLWMANGGQLTAGWFHVKLLAVVLMTCYNLYLVFYYLSLNRGKTPHSIKLLRVLNEIPTFFVIIIVVMVIVRPI